MLNRMIIELNSRTSVLAKTDKEAANKFDQIIPFKNQKKTKKNPNVWTLKRSGSLLDSDYNSCIFYISLSVDLGLFWLIVADV